jgi:hypothetical protein
MDAAATPGALWRLAFVTCLLGAGLARAGVTPRERTGETPDDVRAGELLEQGPEAVSSDAELDAAARTKAGDESVRLLRACSRATRSAATRRRDVRRRPDPDQWARRYRMRSWS